MKSLFLSLLLAAEIERPATYTVQAGDTCQSITDRYFGVGKNVDELHKWNNLGPLPHKLAAGQVLRLREPDSSAPDATLTFMKPAVRARAHGPWEPAKLGMGLFRLNEVNTLKRAGAELTLRDQSQLLLDENALVVIYGEPSAQRVSRGPAVVEGEVRMALTGARGVELPGGATVTTSRADGVVDVDGARTGRVSIFDGDVVVESQKVAVKLSRDQGTVVRPGAPPLPARPLPQPPRPEGFAPLVVTGRGGVAQVEVRWPEVPNARRYRVQLSNDERFLDLAVSASTTSTSLLLERLVPGHYLMRVIAFDIEGLQGRASPALPLDVVTVGKGADASGLVRLRSGEKPTFMGPAGFSLEAGAERLVAGRHTLQVRGAKGEVVAPVTVSVRPSAPKVRVDGNGVLTVEFSEPLASSEGLTVRDGAGAVPLKPRGASAFEAARPLSGTTTVQWDGFDLLRFDR